MAKYWSSPKPHAIADSLVPQYGCHVFSEGRAMAICNAYGRTEEEAHEAAQRIIACLYAVDRLPSAAAKARHYIVRSPKLKQHEGAVTGRYVMQAAHPESNIPRDSVDAADVTPLLNVDYAAVELRVAAEMSHEYDQYQDACEKTNRTPVDFETWLRGRRHE